MIADPPRSQARAMYTRRERPLSEAERQNLRLQIDGLSDSMAGMVGLVITVLALDAMLATALLVVVAEAGWSRILSAVCWLCALAVVNLWAAIAIGEFCRSVFERRQLRAALADGVAVVETLSSRRITHLQIEGRSWYLLAVGEDEVAVLASAEVPYHYPLTRPDPKSSGVVPACFETVTTRCHRLLLGTTRRGRAGFSLETPLDFARLLPDPVARAAALARLQTRPLLRGNLCDLPALLAAPVVSGEVPGDPWDEVQWRVEERFALDFGPGVLRRLRPGNVSELVDLIRRRLPENATASDRPAVNAFYRLRAALVAELSVRRDEVRPATRMEDLVPRQWRRRRWLRVEARLEQRVPAFVLHDGPGCAVFAWGTAIAACWLLGLPLATLVRAYAQLHDLSHHWFIQSVVIGVYIVPAVLFGVMVVLAWRGTRRTEFDAKLATVGAMAREMAAEGAQQPWTEESVYLAVRQMVATVRGGRPMDVTWTTPLADAA